MKNIVKFEDFIKMDFRVATIKQAETVEGSNKLIKLIVDVGEEIGEKQILSGILQWYKPEDLIGQQVMVIINLAPRKIMGYESQGMIVAAEERDVLALMQPSIKVKSGIEIH